MFLEVLKSQASNVAKLYYKNKIIKLLAKMI